MENCLIGKQFGRWTVASLAPRRRSVIYWNCRCSCGTERPVRQYYLTAGSSKSCGCIAKERAVVIGRAHRKHGHSLSGRSRTPTYISWEGMRQRGKVTDDGTKAAYSYAHVAVCERWQDFANFLADMGERPAGKSLDRIDNSRGYSPDNCRWVTQAEQLLNARPKVNRWSDRTSKAHRVGSYP